MKKIVLVLLVFVQFALNAQTPVQIIDETYLDISFKDFAVDLNTAVRKRDVHLLRPLLADTVGESKDGCGFCPREEFIKFMFESPNPKDSWSEWSEVLRFGFYRSNENQFEAPSYRKFLNQDSSLIVLGSKVNIREKPGTNNRVLLQSTFEKFDCDCYVISSTESTFQKIGDNFWQEIRLKDGRKGYVLFDLTSEKILREMTVKKIKGKWKIISFFSPPGC